MILRARAIVGAQLRKAATVRTKTHCEAPGDARRASGGRRAGELKRKEVAMKESLVGRLLEDTLSALPAERNRACLFEDNERNEHP